MALIRCLECNREVSDKAAACPGCAIPMTRLSDQKSTTTEEADDSQVWIVFLGENDERRLTGAEIRSWLAKGLIGSGTLVTQDGRADWQHLSKVASLAKWRPGATTDPLSSRPMVLLALAIAALIGLFLRFSYGVPINLPDSLEVVALSLLAIVAAKLVSNRAADAFGVLVAALVFVSLRWIFSPLGGPFNLLPLIAYYVLLVLGFDLLLRLCHSSKPRSVPPP